MTIKKRAEWTETKSVIIAIESHYGNNFSEHVQRASFITFYYIDTSVLLENIPHVWHSAMKYSPKFIKTTSGTQVVYFP